MAFTMKPLVCFVNGLLDKASIGIIEPFPATRMDCRRHSWNNSDLV